MNTPLRSGLLQSDMNFNGFKPLNADLSGYTFGSALVTANVKDPPYNAVGDGVTDDSAAINAAIQAVFDLGGGTVFFPKGIYLCNGAFNATTNSVLAIPQVSIQTAGEYNEPITVQLLGETPSPPGATSLAGGSRIKCTKTGTGTAPAVLAANAYWGRTPMGGDYLTAMSYTQVIVRNLGFDFAANPSVYGIRLDAITFAIVEDVTLQSPNPPITEPTNGTVGLWMPVCQNFGTNYVNRVGIVGFDTGLVVSEHFSCPGLMVYSCHVGIECIFGNHLSWFGRVHAMMCNTAFKFTAALPVEINVNIEQSDAGWQMATTDIDDGGNTGYGGIRVTCKKIGTGTTVPTVSGGNKLTITNIDSGNTAIASTGAGSGKGFIPIGGTTGQSLKKLSNDDYDVGWA